MKCNKQMKELLMEARKMDNGYLDEKWAQRMKQLLTLVYSDRIVLNKRKTLKMNV